MLFKKLRLPSHHHHHSRTLSYDIYLCVIEKAELPLIFVQNAVALIPFQLVQTLCRHMCMLSL